MGCLTVHAEHIYPRQPRLFLARILITLARGLDRIPGPISRWIPSLCETLVLILSTPRELEELVKLHYASRRSVKFWSEIVFGPRGKLNRWESAFVSNYLTGEKRCLVFQSGGGRESLVLARKGFEVTGIDACVPLVEQARKRAADLGMRCRFEVGDMFDVPAPKIKCDALFLTQIMYSGIPTRQRRIVFLTTARTLLADGGFFYLEFEDDLEGGPNGWRFRIKQCVARLFEGNLELESELVSEFLDAGFAVADVKFAKGYAVLTLPGIGALNPSPPFERAPTPPPDRSTSCTSSRSRTDTAGFGRSSDRPLWAASPLQPGRS